MQGDREATRAAWFALGVLTLINLFNYLDRWVLPAILQTIKADLHFTDTQLGILSSSFILVYMAMSPVFGTLGDRRRRPPLIAIGVAIWSIATALGGLARGFFSLFTARAMVGVGEAAFGSIGPALLSDHFPYEKRGRVYAILFSAIPIGSAAGYVVGGYIDHRFGWRAAFFIAGLPGLLLALLAMTVKDVPRGQYDPPEIRDRTTPKELKEVYLDFIRNRAFIITVLGYAAYTFALGALAVWTPSFLEVVRGVPRSQATVSFGLVVLITGFVGTFIGGFLGDFCLRWTKNAYLWVCGVSMLIAAPLTYIAFTEADRSIYWPAMIAAQIFVFASTGPVNSAIVNLVSPGERATAIGFSTFMIHILGDVPSPALIGYVSHQTSLETAFLIVPVAVLVSGLIWSYGAWRGQ